MWRCVLLLAFLLSWCTADFADVTPDWGRVLARTHAIPTYLNQVNPSMDRESPIHDEVFSRMGELRAGLVRYLHWSNSGAPFPELEPGVFNFTLCDRYVSDFMRQPNAETAMINFDAPPAWLHVNNDAGAALRDPSGREVGEWISRIVSWYTKGGFRDPRTGITYRSQHRYKWRSYEVLNEPDLEDFLCDRRNQTRCVEAYTKVYDGIASVLSVEHPELELAGLSLAGSDSYGVWFEHFFKASSHRRGSTPPAQATIHFYALPPGPTDVATTWPAPMFRQAAAFIGRVEKAVPLLAQSDWGRGVKINVNEIGVIGGANCPVDALFSNSSVFWNLQAALWGYYYGELARLGAHAVAASQIMGYPADAFKIGGQGVPLNYPCVSMLDWHDGSGTARFWVLKLFIEVLGDGPKAVVSVKMSSTVPAGDWPLPSTVYATGFQRLDGTGERLVLLTNTNSSSSSATVLGASGGTAFVVDADWGHGEVPYGRVALHGDEVALGPLAVAVIRMPASGGGDVAVLV